MKLLWQVSLCCLLAAGTAMPQRGGGGGGMRGGGGGGGAYSGGMRGGFGGANGGGFQNGGYTGARAGFNGGGNFIGNFNGSVGRVGGFGFRNGFRDFDDRFGFNRGFNRGFYGGFYGGGFWPYAGYSSMYWPSYAWSSYFPGYDYNPYDYGYAAYQPSPNVTVVYPPQPVQPLTAERARPVTREYDQYGQEIRPAGSPLYLIAFTDHTIRAAISYRIDGNTLHYTTAEREEKEAPLNTVDRPLSTQLNRERQVPFQLPPQ